MVVHPDSNRISRVRFYSGTLLKTYHFNLQDFHLLRLSFPAYSDNDKFCNFYEGPTTPKMRASLVWAIPISLAATFGISFDFFSLGYSDGSILPVSLCYTIYSCNNIQTLLCMGFPIRSSTDQGLFAAPRRFSQLTTTFLALLCQVIPR